MKEFEEWAKENGCTADSCWNDWDDGYNAGIRSGWRAALEEVLKHTTKDTCSLMTELRNWIKKELEE